MKEGSAIILSVTVTNNTNHNITLPGRVVLGRLQLVRSVTPVEVRFKDPETPTPCERPPCKQDAPAEKIESNLSWLPEVDLSGPTAEQKEQAKQLLVREADTFAMKDDDVGCVPELEMDIGLRRTCLNEVLSGSPNHHSQVVLSVFARKMVERGYA